MRRTIETAPRDAKVVILEGDADGIYDVAHWSTETAGWISETGVPSKITPTHWYPMQGDNYLAQGLDVSSSPSQGGPSASLARRSRFPFSLRRVAPKRPTASDGIAPRSDAMAAPASVAAVEAQPAPVEAKRTPHAWWGFATSSIAATLIVGALIGMYFRAEVAAYVTRHAGHQDFVGISSTGGQVVEQVSHLQSDSLPLQQQAETHQANAQAGTAEAAQVKQPVGAPAPELRQSAEKEQRAEVLANELAEARRGINTLNLQLRTAAANSAELLGQEREKTAALTQDAAAARRELTASTVQHRHALEEERARGAALANELAMARREIDTQAALLSKAADEPTQFMKAAESAMAELRRSLQREHDRAEALASELASARRDVETQVALSSKKGDEAEQLKQAAESATAELRQSPQQEHDRAEALARDLASARRMIDGRVPLERTANSQIVQMTQAAEVAVTKQPAAAETQGSPEAARLIARARALLGQGNIGAARIVLERAAETGSAQASFMLAETYDPLILSAWGTYGTRGEATKARELYTRAHEGGIQEAKDRFNALR
jgi:hypothetical protein